MAIGAGGPGWSITRTGAANTWHSLHRTPRRGGAVTWVGSGGDSDDTALAETIIGLYKAELIRRRGPGKGLDEVE